MIKDIRPALRAYLLADAAIFARVGGNRVFPNQVPQGLRGDSLVYQRITGTGDHHMQGASGLMTARTQLVAWSAGQDAAEALANLAKFRLDGFRGTMGAGAAAVRVQGVFYESENPEQFDQAVGMWGIGRDYMITFNERQA